MSKTPIQLWVEDLESGEHEQVKGYMHILPHGGLPEGFCCLGRLCVLAIEKGECQIKSTVEDRSAYDVRLNARLRGRRVASVSYDGERSFPSTVIRVWSGVKKDKMKRYADMNDHGASFETIAAKIREDFPEHFRR